MAYLNLVVRVILQKAILLLKASSFFSKRQDISQNNPATFR